MQQNYPILFHVLAVISVATGVSGICCVVFLRLYREKYFLNKLDFYPEQSYLLIVVKDNPCLPLSKRDRLAYQPFASFSCVILDSLACLI